ncbi:MAG TPA: HAD-IIIC family phosphatase [Methylomirabilota bacterium]|nr:HAD-IIIC family phosphatase [Methylomirabilota bacterium]
MAATAHAPAFLDSLDDPIRGALALQSDDGAGEGALLLLQDVLSRYGSRIGPKTMHALARHAKSAALGADAAVRAAQIRAIGTPAAQWYAAAMLESAGSFEAAAEALDVMDDVSWGEERALRLEALARNRLRAGDAARVGLPLRYAAQATQTRQTLVSLDRLLTQAQQSADLPVKARRRIAVLGSGVLDFWAGLLRPALFGFDIGCEILTGEYDQYQQEIRDPSSRLAKFRPEIVVLAVNWRSLGLLDETADPAATVRNLIDGMAALWRTCQHRYRAAVIQLNFEIPEVDPLGRLSAASPGGRARVIHTLNLELWDAAQQARVAVLDVEQLAAATGKRNWSDPGMWIAAKQYPTTDAVPLLTRNLAALVRAVCGLTSKCAVLDLDGTLWGGVIGEDGLDGIRLGGDAEGEAYTAFHQYLLGLRRRGIPLAVCSKNNEDDARSVFRRHPETVLKEDDFAVFLANWEPKPDNLKNIAAMLNIGVDSLVFLDDNPVERNLVRRELPEVEVPELPDDPARYAEALHATYLFESLSLTDEDRRRADTYRDNVLRTELAEGSTNLDDYLVSLRMKVDLRPFDETNLPRIVQLINKTNQFSLTTRRTTASEVMAWMQDPACYTQFMRLQDRFGDSGVTGAMVAVREGETLRIVNWLMSCRVLGRRIENLMLASLIRHARRAGVAAVIGEYLPTAKNGQTSDLFDRFGFERIEEREDGGRLYRAAVPAEDEPVTWCEVTDTTAAEVSAV